MKLNFLLVFCSVVFCLNAQNTFKTSIFFQKNRAELDETALKELTALSDQLKKFPDYHVEIEAHADESGSEFHNLKLSERRAAVVSDFLSDAGIDVQKIDSRAFGEKSPDYSNLTEDGMQKNRRVDLVANVFTFKNLPDFFEKFSEIRFRNLSFPLIKVCVFVGKKARCSGFLRIFLKRKTAVPLMVRLLFALKRHIQSQICWQIICPPCQKTGCSKPAV